MAIPRVPTESSGSVSEHPGSRAIAEEGGLSDPPALEESVSVMQDRDLSSLVAAAQRQSTHDVLRPLCLGLAIIWLIFIPFNIIDLPAGSQLSVVLHDSLMLIGSLALYVAAGKKWIPIDWTGPVTLILACLISSNVLLVYWVTESSLYTYYIGIILIGAGNVILMTRWFASTGLLILLSWAFVASRFASPQEFADLAFLQAASLLIAVTIHLARVRFIRHITQLRQRDQDRERDLESALSQAELARQELDLRVAERTRELQIAYDSLTSQLEERAQLEDDRRALETELHHAQRLESVGQLAGGVAHDFNNLLTVIGGNIDLVVRKAQGISERHKIWLEEARNATGRAVALTGELLAYSRKQPVVFETIDPVEVVGGVRKMIERAAGEIVTLEFALSPMESFIRGGKGQIEQVIMNLVLNACDAMPVGGELRIELDELNRARKTGSDVQLERPYVRLRVVDNGMGMDPETREKIFEPFFTTKETGKGTGLGLSVVHGIVTQHKGFLEVESTPGEGSAFSVYLPCAPKWESEESIDLSPALEVQASGETILVVEDEDAVRRFSETLLEELGYRVLAAENGEHALELARQYEGMIDLLLTDVVMPGIQGPQLAAQLMKIRPMTPVLYVSGYTDPKILADLDLGDRRAFLQKPFTRDGLQTQIRSLIGSDTAGK